MSEWMNERNPTNKGNERTNQLNELKNQQTNKRLVTARRNKWRTNAALKHNSSALKRQLNWTELNWIQCRTQQNRMPSRSERKKQTQRIHDNDTTTSSSLFLSLFHTHPHSHSHCDYDCRPPSLEINYVSRSDTRFTKANWYIILFAQCKRIQFSIFFLFS